MRGQGAAAECLAVPGGGGEALEAVGRPGVRRGGSRLLPERGRGYCRPSPRG